MKGSYVWLVVSVGAHNFHVECRSLGGLPYMHIYIYTYVYICFFKHTHDLGSKLLAEDVVSSSRDYLQSEPNLEAPEPAFPRSTIPKTLLVLDPYLRPTPTG